MLQLSRIIVLIILPMLVYGQSQKSDIDIKALIDQYSLARENRDTSLLKSILTHDIDQLVSTGEWRNGIATAVKGMMSSSANNPGSRTLILEKIKYLTSKSAIADCRYEITDPDGSVRKMWSAFVVVRRDGKWRIAGIRNMMPSGG